MAEDNENGDDEGEREALPYVGISPTTRIKGTLPEDRTEIFYGGSLGNGVEQNDARFGIVLEDAEVVNGTLFRNEEKPDDATMEDAIDEDSSRATDYRVADTEDRGTTVVKGSLTTDEESMVDDSRANVYDEADAFDEDRIVVWFNGLSGERIARVLDFNGMPFATWYSNDDGTHWLQKGLLQVHPDWRDADSDERSDLKDDNKGPRVARIPILRKDVLGEEVLIDMSRFLDSRAYEVHVFDADEFEDELGSEDAEIPRDDVGYAEDVDAEFRFASASERDEDSPNEDIDGVMEEFDVNMYMYTDGSWQDEPAGWTPSYGGFDVDPGVSDEDQVDAQYEKFAESIADQIGDGMTPEDTYGDGGIEQLIEKNSEKFLKTPSADEIRRRIYEELAWLDVDDLDEE